MKVAVLIDTWFPFIGGGQINAYEISRILAEKGVEIEIITRNCGRDNLILHKNLKITKLGRKSDPADWLSKITFSFTSFFYIYRNSYDLVHAHAFLPGITARSISVFRGIPSILTVHGTSVGTGLNNKFSTLLEKFILTGIYYNAQITVSRDFLHLKNTNKKIYYVSNAVKVEMFDKVSAKKPLNPTILFVGRLHSQKNIISLIKAVKILKMEIPDIKLILAGDGPLKEKIKQTIKKDKLQNNILVLGPVLGNDLIRLYKSSSIFVLPSVYEGQSLAVLEAWAAKIPVIASDTGDSQYLVKNGVNGYLFKSLSDDKKLAGTIKIALSGKKLNEMGTNGYNFVKKNFSWKKSAELTLKVYENVTQTPH